jgi:hypothetical protein
MAQVKGSICLSSSITKSDKRRLGQQKGLNIKKENNPMTKANMMSRKHNRYKGQNAREYMNNNNKSSKNDECLVDTPNGATIVTN